MSRLFSPRSAPTPAPLPPAPTEDHEAEKQRANAARQAQVDAALSGRGSTMFAGKHLLDEEQPVTRSAKRRSVASDLYGG